MDQAFTLRNLMSGRSGNPLGALSRYSQTRILVPKAWHKHAFRVLAPLASRAHSETTLMVDLLTADAGISRVAENVYRVGSEKLHARVDEDVSSVIKLRNIWVILPYLENEEHLRWMPAKTAEENASGRTILIHQTSSASLLDACKQLRTLSSRCGVKEVSSLIFQESQGTNASRAHTRVQEMGNNFLRTEVTFLGNLKVDPDETLLHWIPGEENETSLVSISENLKLHPTQNASSRA